MGPVVSATPSTRPSAIILGGGISALTAAYELSEGRWWDRFARIAVYQQGWRLGGKAASGRNVERQDRIEEHGLHIWFGYYENAFRMLAHCHEELDRIALAHIGDDEAWQRWSPAMTSIDQAFRPCSTIGLADDEPDGSWTQWLATFPEGDASPWDRDVGSEPPGWDLGWYLGNIGRRTVELLHTAIRSLVNDVERPGLEFELAGDGPARFAEPVLFADMMLRSIDPLLYRLVDLLTDVSNRLRRQADRRPDDELVRLVLGQIDAVDRIVDFVRQRLDEQVRRNTTARRAMVVLDLFLGVTRGLLHHRVVCDDDLDALDDWDWDQWLASEGVRIESRESSLVRGLSYSLPFAYVDGTREAPSFSAGVGLRLFLRTFFTYRGALMWKANAGFGDVVFAPLFELLVKRGVDFHFFRRVVDLEVDHVNHQVARIHMRCQRPDDAAPPTNASRLAWYRDKFLHTVHPREGSRMGMGTLKCWPSRPLRCWGPGAFDDEALLGVPTDAGDPLTLELAPNDVVVLGLPVGVIAHVGRQLLSDPRWRDQVGRIKRVPTQAAQLWLHQPCNAALGWPRDVVTSGFTEPFDTFADMPVLTSQEGPGLGASTVIYLCGVLFDPDDRPDRDHLEPPFSVDGERSDLAEERRWLGKERDWVRTNLATFLIERAAQLWPPAVRTVPRARTLANAFDLGLLADPTGINRVIEREYVGYDRIVEEILDGEYSASNPAAPYYRANVQPSDRYVLSLPGTARYRLAPSESGLINLFPVGDWTACVLNAGCMEAATISGLLAAEAITGQARQIVGRQNLTIELGARTVGPDLYWSTA